jgi:hypothetical protein
MANFASDISARRYYATHGQFGTAPQWFTHAAATGKPAEPAFPDTLTADEQTQVNAWLHHARLGQIALAPYPTLPNASAKVEEFKTYFASAAYLAWLNADRVAREMQWRWFCADALHANEATTPPSADSTGAGSSPPGGWVPRCVE